MCSVSFLLSLHNMYTHTDTHTHTPTVARANSVCLSHVALAEAVFTEALVHGTTSR